MRYIIAILASFSLLFGYLSYSFHASKIKAESALKGALDASLSLQSSLDKKEKECLISLQSSAEWQKEKQDADREKESAVAQIDNTPKKGAISPRVGITETEPDEIDIDSALPESIKRVLDETFSRLSK